ncbi:hypothetical protein Taro_038505 [Colocasia esculenta]|uniref:Uncharacterized protein n=1 Tax=Colocasia esculenta TaxID=4460 RepID=A0A843WMF9_COLES|nr:hypothetical protein [Colocasia esculenta]
MILLFSCVLVKKRCLPNHQSMQIAEISVHNEAENLEANPLHNGAYEQEFHPSVGVDERDSNDVVESNSSNIQATLTSISKLRATRGPTQKTAFEPPQGMKWTCIFVRGQPIGTPASKLAGTLGLYARNESYFSPYKKWKQQSMQSFNDVMKEIMVKFEFVNGEGMPANIEDVNKFCFKSIQTKLKEWRCELKKKGYMKGENQELSIEPPELRITQATWDCLVQYWGTDEVVHEAERNKKNRAQEQATHTLGAKSIARHNQEQEKVIEICQEKDLMNSSNPTVLSPILDAVCNGHHGGYERGCGLGWSRMSRWGDIGNQSSNDNIKQLTVELQNAKAEIEAMHAREKEREEAAQAREREMQDRMERMEAMLSKHFSNSAVSPFRLEILHGTMQCPTIMLIEMEHNPHVEHD